VKVKGVVGEGGGEVSVERVKWERRELGVRIILRIEEGVISCRPFISHPSFSHATLSSAFLTSSSPFLLRISTGTPSLSTQYL